ncbi:hypothetical protein ACFQ2B_26100 [Streptomyces stramineus]
MVSGSRLPIRIGSGYIDITPTLNRERVKEMRGELTRQMELAGAAAGKSFSTAAAGGMAAISKATAAAAKTANGQIQQEAAGTKAKLTVIEKELTREFGQQAALRFRAFQEAEERKREALAGTSQATRRALAETVRLETQASRDAAQRWRAAERERINLLMERRRAEALAAAEREREERAAVAARRRALEDEARMDREIHQAQIRMAREAARAAEQAEREKRAAIRQTMAERQAEQSAAIGGQLAIAQAARQSLREQAAEHQRTMATVQATQVGTLATLRSGWRRTSQHIEATGTAATETGNLVTRGLVAPLGLASAAAATFGIKSADAMIQAQTGLRGMGIALKDVNSLLEQMTEYGIQTPYSVNDMLKYGTRFVRANSSHNADFLSDDPERRAKGSADSAQRAVDMVKMVGDSAAFGGIMDPAMVSRGMYAIEVMQDQGRTNLRNVKQLEAATGMPSNVLAQVLGFRTRKYTPQEMQAMRDRDKKNGMSRKIPETYEASGQMLAFMQNAKETGGVSGEQLIDGLLKRWKTEPNMRGAAHRMGSATISGRMEQMKEQAQFNLGKLFYSKTDSGEYGYTGLGESIMGKKVSDEKGTRFEGGLLKDAGQIGTKVLPIVKRMLTKFFETLGTFTRWIKSTVEFLDEHPALRDAILEAGKLAATVAPFLLAFGLLTKTVGKLGKLLLLIHGPAKVLAGAVGGAARGARGATRYGRQVAGGIRSRRGGGRFLDGYDARRDNFRDQDQRRRRDRQRVRQAGRENGRFRTAAGYGRYATARVTGYDGVGDWVQRRGNRRTDMRDLDRRSREAFADRRLTEGIRLNRRRDAVRDEYGENRRTARRTAAERLRPQDSTDRRDTARRGLQDAERQIRQVDERIEALTRALDAVNRAPLGSLIDHLGSSTGQSVRSTADQAQTAIRRIVTDGTTPLNNAGFGELHRKLSEAQQKAGALEGLSGRLARRSAISMTAALVLCGFSSWRRPRSAPTA